VASTSLAGAVAVFPACTYRDHNVPACTASPHVLQLVVHVGALLAATQCTVNLDRNLKPKLAIMCQCSSVTDRQTDTDIVA